MPESKGFLLVGGAALAAQELTTRPTQDLDLFTRAGGSSVPVARDAFEDAVRSRGWTVRRIRDSDTFCRLVLTGEEELLVDLAVDSPPNSPPSPSVAGSFFGLEELAGRKVIALFDRAEARDFADVYVLAQRYEPELLLRLAAEVGAGFDIAVFAVMLGSLERFADYSTASGTAPSLTSPRPWRGRCWTALGQLPAAVSSTQPTVESNPSFRG